MNTATVKHPEMVKPARMNHKKPRGHKVYQRRMNSIIAIFVGLVWILPVYWMVKSAFQQEKDLLSNPPKPFVIHATLAHFQKVIADPAFWNALKTSLILATLTVVFATLFSLMFSVALSRYNFKFRIGMVIALLVVQMIPGEALFVSQYKMLNTVGMLNLAGLVVLYVGSHVPFMSWMMRGYVDAVPVDLEEAAQVDGCSRFGAFMKVTLPLLTPGIIATAVFGFLFAWNEYTLALIILAGSKKQNLPIWLQSFQSGEVVGTDWGGVMAGATLMAVPVIIMFLIIQKRISKGTLGGAVKG